MSVLFNFYFFTEIKRGYEVALKSVCSKIYLWWRQINQRPDKRKPFITGRESLVEKTSTKTHVHMFITTKTNAHKKQRKVGTESIKQQINGFVFIHSKSITVVKNNFKIYVFHW